MRKIIIVFLIIAMILLPFMPANADQRDYFLNSINSIRANQGLSSLNYYAPLNNVAQNWVTYMSTNNRLIHNMNLPNEISGWRFLGENIGYGYSLSQLEQALEQSPDHYANMVNPYYTLIGIAVTQSNGRYWVTEDFMAPSVAAISPRVIQRPLAKPKIVVPKPDVNKIVTNANTSATTNSTMLPLLDTKAPISKPDPKAFLQTFYQLILSDGIPMRWN